MRRPLVLGNWKMHGSRESVASLVSGLCEALSGVAPQIDRGVCPPFVYLGQVSELAAGSPESAISLGGQDLSVEKQGAHTGDIAGEMLKEFACTYVLVGHSERRADHQESSELVAQKYLRALEAGLVPVLCVGETLAEREAEQTLSVIEAQCQAVLQHLNAEQKDDMVIAYEPVWAIGTGKTATPDQAQEVHQFIRKLVDSEKVRILYGGSVKADNATELFQQPDIDGGLVGGASLDVDSFVQIIKAAQ